MSSTAEIKTEEKTFQFEWTIPNWVAIQPKVDEVLKQKFTFSTLLVPTVNISWEVGFAKKETELRNVLFYQKLVKLPDALNVLDTTIKISLLNNNGAVITNPTRAFQFVDQKVHTFNTGFYLPGNWSTHIFSTGCIKFAIELIVRFPCDLILSQSSSLILEKFNNALNTRTCKKWAALLENMEDSDLKIRTNDDQEILAHKLVVKVQCPSFASTFHSEFSGTTAATVTTAQISAKTMKILLHYFYSGELLESWCDKDVIVEFTSAVAKYKMQEVSDMLDEALGNTDDKDSWENDWKLLKLARKMSLKQAAKRLNDRIVNTTRTVQTADELLELFRNVDMTDEDGEERGLLVRVNSA